MPVDFLGSVGAIRAKIELDPLAMNGMLLAKIEIWPEDLALADAKKKEEKK